MKLLALVVVIGLITSCGKKDSPVAGEPHQKEIEENFSLFEGNKKLITAELSSPYSVAILGCALEKEGKGCTPERVPLLGMRENELDASYILSNTIVSHDFLAQNFKDYLKSVSNKYLLALFGSVSGVVITDEISSSFYYNPTGMIYINASYLWKTQKEYAKLKFKKDGRSSQDKRKKVSIIHDYVKNNKVIYFEARKKERVLADFSPNLTRLLFHELTHANDVYPADSLDTLDKTKSYLELRIARYESKEMISRKIDYPETTRVWEYSMFFVEGVLINPDGHLFSREDFVTDFAPNTGMVFYSYTTNREHLAMMMESYFMLFTESYETCTYGVHRESNEKKSKVFWFQKNRILQKNILLEARSAIDLMLPNTTASELNSMDTTFSEFVSGEKFPTCKNN